MNELSIIAYFNKSGVTPTDFLALLGIKSVEFAYITPSDLGQTYFGEETPIKVTLKFDPKNSLGVLQSAMPLIEKVAK